MIHRYHGAIEADLLDKHLDLLDLWRGKLTLRRVKVVIDNLGPGSALHRAVSGTAWTDTDYLLAHVIDAERLALWQRSNEGAKNPSAKPSPYLRPGEAEAKQERLDASARAFKRDKRRG